VDAEVHLLCNVEVGPPVSDQADELQVDRVEPGGPSQVKFQGALNRIEYAARSSGRADKSPTSGLRRR